jgi:hypothetical protein
MKLESLKHLVECNCILPQFMELPNPPFHKFIVFSTINIDGSINPSYAQCNNCQILHLVQEVGVSKILPKESSGLAPKIQEIKAGMPKELIETVEGYEPDIVLWQEVRFIWENEYWGRHVILMKERDGNSILGKYLRILGTRLFKVETFSIEEE